MTNIVGIQKGSGETPLSGILRVTLDGQITDVDTTPDSIHSPIPENYTITAGVININIPQSETSNVTYHFQFITLDNVDTFYLPDGGVYNGVTHINAGQYYTGATHTVASILLTLIQTQKETVVVNFHAIVPNLVSVEWASLNETGVTTDTLDTSLRRLAEILQTNQDFVNSIRPRQLGAWNPLAYYGYTDTVGYGGSSWTWISLSPGAGIVPSVNFPSNQYWGLTASKGDPGGTGGQDTPYSAIAWDGDLNAPSKNVLRDKFETMASLVSPAFTGAPTAPTPPASDVSSLIATTANVYLKGLLLINNTALTGNPTAVTQPNADRSTRLATCEYVKNTTVRYSSIEERFSSSPGNTVAGQNSRKFNTIVENAGDILELSAGVFRLRVGTYKMSVKVLCYNPGSYKLTLLQNAPSVTTIKTGLTGHGTADAYAFLDCIFSTSDELEQYSISHWIETAQTNGYGYYSNVHGSVQIFGRVEFLRLD